jgi:hypothetical protein
MTQDDCKLITELLGEYWIDNTADVRKWLPSHNRTFTTPKDFFACFEKLVEGGKWDDFDEYAYQIYCQETAGRIPSEDIRYNQWLLSRTESGHYRLCVLVAEWLKTQKPQTMDKVYHDGSGHLMCPKCGFCLPCGDCKKWGCGWLTAQTIKENKDGH